MNNCTQLNWQCHHQLQHSSALLVQVEAECTSNRILSHIIIHMTINKMIFIIKYYIINILDYFKLSIFILSTRILGLSILQIVKYNFAKKITTNSNDDKKFIELSENHFHENESKWSIWHGRLVLSYKLKLISTHFYGKKWFSKWCKWLVWGVSIGDNLFIRRSRCHSRIYWYKDDLNLHLSMYVPAKQVSFFHH